MQSSNASRYPQYLLRIPYPQAAISYIAAFPLIIPFNPGLD